MKTKSVKEKLLLTKIETVQYTLDKINEKEKQKI